MQQSTEDSMGNLSNSCWTNLQKLILLMVAEVSLSVCLLSHTVLVMIIQHFMKKSIKIYVDSYI